MAELKERVKEFLDKEKQETLKHLQGQHNQKLHGNRGGKTNLGEGESDNVNIGPHVLQIRHFTNKDEKTHPVFYFRNKIPQSGFVPMDRKTAIKWGKLVNGFLKTNSLTDSAYKASVKIFGKEIVDKAIEKTKLDYQK